MRLPAWVLPWTGTVLVPLVTCSESKAARTRLADASGFLGLCCPDRVMARWGAGHFWLSSLVTQSVSKAVTMLLAHASGFRLEPLSILCYGSLRCLPLFS